MRTLSSLSLFYASLKNTNINKFIIWEEIEFNWIFLFIASAKQQSFSFATSINFDWEHTQLTSAKWIRKKIFLWKTLPSRRQQDSIKSVLCVFIFLFKKYYYLFCFPFQSETKICHNDFSRYWGHDFIWILTRETTRLFLNFLHTPVDKIHSILDLSLRIIYWIQILWNEIFQLLFREQKKNRQINR